MGLEALFQEPETESKHISYYTTTGYWYIATDVLYLPKKIFSMTAQVSS